MSNLVYYLTYQGVPGKKGMEGQKGFMVCCCHIHYFIENIGKSYREEEVAR